MKFRSLRLSRGKTITEYIIVVVLLMSCSVALYFSVLVSGTEKLGNMLCNECPEQPNNSVDPWDRDSEDQARDDDNDDGKDDDGKNDDPVIPDDGNVGDDPYGGINDEFWGYFWNSFFDWDNWF